MSAIFPAVDPSLLFCSGKFALELGNQQHASYPLVAERGKMISLPQIYYLVLLLSSTHYYHVQMVFYFTSQFNENGTDIKTLVNVSPSLIAKKVH